MEKEGTLIKNVDTEKEMNGGEWAGSKDIIQTDIRMTEFQDQKVSHNHLKGVKKETVHKILLLMKTIGIVSRSRRIINNQVVKFLIVVVSLFNHIKDNNLKKNKRVRSMMGIKAKEKEQILKTYN